MKLNRIIQFVETETDEKELSVDQSKELKNILFRACDSGLLNKLTEVNYNEEEACIISFKSLEFNEETNKYKIEIINLNPWNELSRIGNGLITPDFKTQDIPKMEKIPTSPYK